MDGEKDKSPDSNSNPVDNDRREFLRKSIYAAYATPLITALLVEEASAGKSNGNGNCPPGLCKKDPKPPCCYE